MQIHYTPLFAGEQGLWQRSMMPAKTGIGSLDVRSKRRPTISVLMVKGEEYRGFSQKTSPACFQVIMPGAESFIYSSQFKYARRGAVCPGDSAPVLNIRVKCSPFKAKAAHFSVLTHIW